MTVPCRSLSLTRSRFQPAARQAAVAAGGHVMGFPRFRRPRVGRSGDGRPDTWFLGQGRSGPLSFVSYNPLVSKRLSNLKGASSYLVARVNCGMYWTKNLAAEGNPIFLGGLSSRE